MYQPLSLDGLSLRWQKLRATTIHCVPKALEIGSKIQDNFGKAYKRGVKIAFGTDAGVYLHGDNGKEFGYMVEAGMPAIEAILSAMQVNANIMGMGDKVGSIEKESLPTSSQWMKIQPRISQP